MTSVVLPFPAGAYTTALIDWVFWFAWLVINMLVFLALRNLIFSKGQLQMELLAAYIKRNKLSLRDFGSKLGVSHCSVRNWIRGIYMPSLKQAIAIEKETKGFVSVYSWK